MRGHQQTISRSRIREWFWLPLLVALVAPAVRAQERSPVDSVADSADLIELAADRIQFWDSGGSRWALLTGQAAVVQGLEGLRADAIVVRVDTLGAGGDKRYRADVYAEGNARPVGPPRTPQKSLRTQMGARDVLLKPYDEKSGVVPSKGPPRGAGIVNRASAVLAQPAVASAEPGTAVAPARSDHRQVRESARPPLVPDLGPAPAPAPVDAAVMRTQAIGEQPAPAPAPVDAAVVRTQATQALPSPGPAPIPPPRESAVEAAAAPPPGPAPAPAPGALPAGSDRAAQAPLPPPTRGPAAFQTAPSDSPDAPGGGLIVPPPTPNADLDLPPLEGTPVGPGAAAPGEPPPTELSPLPDPETPSGRGPRRRPGPPIAPIIPGSQRVFRILPRNGGPDFEYHTLPTTEDGVQIIVARGGITIVCDMPPPHGTVDLSADSAIIWRHGDPDRKGETLENGMVVEDAHAPLEVYLEGHVVVRQDNRTNAGATDQKVYRAEQIFYDLRSDRMVSNTAEADLFAPSLVAPMKVKSPRIEQFRPLQMGADGNPEYGPEQIRADRSVLTGSRFPNPGYTFTNRSIDLTKRYEARIDPRTGEPFADTTRPNTLDSVWEYDARQNVFWIGRVPFFYWPRIRGDSDDETPPLQNFMFASNNYLGQQVYTDWNVFRLFNFRRPKAIDYWNLDIDYLSMRTQDFPGLGTEMGWNGVDLGNDLANPYRYPRRMDPSGLYNYYGYLNVYFLRDYGVDDLGSGPAIVTNKMFLANGQLAGRAGYQRGPNSLGHGIPNLGVPPFQTYRGRFTARHMQYLLPDTEETRYDDLRLQLEVGAYSDRYYLEEYFKRQFETGLDQETLAYLIYQHQSSTYTLWTEANTQAWNTDTQWLPRLDHYKLGASLLGDTLTYSGHSGIDYANVSTANEVNNPNIFAFMPYDPISNTNGPWSSGRVYSNHELDLPIKLQFIRFVPYVQGQVMGWTDQIGGESLGRAWGAAGVRADFMMWKAFPTVESELLNVHGLNHKVNFWADYRDAYSNVNLNQIGIQDDLDDNTYETVRRYFALTNFVGGVLPGQYDPRFLILRRTLSPISASSDVQASMNTLTLGIHQRLQTKRGPEGKRRIMDWMTLDLATTYFPQASRDDFNKPFGQNMYNWWWFVGDRTAFYSYGWFEFWDIGGLANSVTNAVKHDNPFGLNVVNSGVVITRPPRANITVGYTVINTGPINTSALNTSINYWFSPKWYGTFSNSYDFGNGISLGTSLSVTRIGADWLTSLGLTVDPQRQSYQAAVMISPRLSPNVRLGSGAGQSSLDSRYAPTQ